MSHLFLKDNKKTEPHEDPLRLNVFVYRGKKRISSIELYHKMNFPVDTYSRWGKNIISRGILGEDYIIKTIKGKKGPRTKEYLLTTSFARELCFFASTNKAFALRTFIIEEEKKFTF